MKIISPRELHDIIGTLPAGTVAIIDVRSPDEFRSGHIEGSINMPLETVLTHAETLRAYTHVYLYCRSGNRSGQACARLHDSQIPHAVSIEGGISEMRKAGFVVIGEKGPLPLQQQVLLGAGAIVATGIILSILVSPWFQLISLFASFGLMYAGISGNCLLANVLSRMPWNRRT